MFSFKTATPESVGIPSGAIEKYVQKLNDQRQCLHSITVIKDGAMVFDAAYSPMTATEKHRMYSCSKSFVSMAIGLLQSEGKLSIHDRVAQYFPEYDTPDLHPWLKYATIRDMLCMADCHTANTYDMNKEQPDMDWVDTWFRTPPSHKPDTIFQYNTICTVMMCVIIERITGITFLEYLKPRVFAPLDMTPDIECVRTPCGHAWGGSGILCSAYDLAKFAYLCMHNGNVNGMQLLPADYVAQATAYQIDNTLDNGYFEHQQGYGYQLWRIRHNGFAFFGMGSQFAYCYPDQDLMVVLTGDTQANTTAADIQVQSIADHLLCALSPSPLPEDSNAFARLTALGDSLTLRATDGDAYSPIIPQIDGKTFRFPENMLGWKWARFDFGAQEGRITYENISGEHMLSFAAGRNIGQELFEPSIYTMDIGHPGNRPVRVFANAAWKDEQTLHLIFYVCDVCFDTVQLTFRFAENTLTVAGKRAAEWVLYHYDGFATGTME